VCMSECAVSQASEAGEEGEPHSKPSGQQHPFELYRDKYVTVTSDAIIIQWYYFPLGTSKRIPFASIVEFSTDRELQLFDVDYKNWGMGLNNIWWAWGCSRSQFYRDKRKKHLVITTNSWIRKGFSAENVPAVLLLLKKLVPLHQDRPAT